MEDPHRRLKGGQLDISTQKERFSFAYIQAVASHAGYQVVEPLVDRDSVDGILMSDFGQRPQINFQAKATSQDVLRGSQINFPLSLKNYNDLRAETIVPRILIVLLMPQEEAEWLRQTPEELCLRYSAYWLCLRNLGSVSNVDSVTVHVPTANVFASEQLNDLMQRVERGEELC